MGSKLAFNIAFAHEFMPFQLLNKHYPVIKGVVISISLKPAINESISNIAGIGRGKTNKY
jgi:hypothetical protein